MHDHLIAKFAGSNKSLLVENLVDVILSAAKNLNPSYAGDSSSRYIGVQNDNFHAFSPEHLSSIFGSCAIVGSQLPGF